MLPQSVNSVLNQQNIAGSRWATQIQIQGQRYLISHFYFKTGYAAGLRPASRNLQKKIGETRASSVGTSGECLAGASVDLIDKISILLDFLLLVVMPYYYLALISCCRR